MHSEFKGKTVMITGAGKHTGIGFGTANKMASYGANVVVTDLKSPPIKDAPIAYGSLDELKMIADELNARYGVKTLALEMDVTRSDSVNAAMEAVKETFGSLDFLCNNAGTAIGAPQNTHEYDESAWVNTVDVNLHGVFRVSKAAVPLMTNPPCAIVNIASRAGKTPAKLNGAYSVSKAGAIMITKVMALELAEKQIRVNAVCPGLIMTDLQVGNIALKAVVFGTSAEEAEEQLKRTVPLNRIGSIDEVADLSAFLLSSRSAYITGQAINIGGGILMEV
ncbi:MAG: SDR family NAD(P)-dependent oxidoreductase [Desulfobacterales bacterium]